LRRRLISANRTSITISLFAEPSIAPRAPSSFALSIVVHGLVVGFFYFVLFQAPRIVAPPLSQRFALRQLDLHSPEPLDPDFPRYPDEARYEIPYPHLDSSASTISPELADAMRTFLGSAARLQTLIQPEINTHLSFAQQIPLPNLIIWTPGRNYRKKLVAPRPVPDTSSYVTPSLELPNQEIKLANIAVAATDIPSKNEAMPASPTSPVEESVAKPLQMPPVTPSTSAEEPTTAAVLSLSTIRMEEGTVILPPVNDLAKSTAVAKANKPGDGSGKGTGATGSAPADASSLSDAETITSDGRRLSTEHFQFPRDGKFNVVVVGTTLADDYPQTADLWGSRVAYTAYLHVGTKKNWILQYSATRSADLAGAGNVARLEAPWPYDLLRPNLLARDINGDALIVHGILNQAGRLESLAIAFPSTFRYASFVLHALREWHFRPARQNGQPTAVEVLIIIPEELD
jgi:hypothetical protein